MGSKYKVVNNGMTATIALLTDVARLAIFDYKKYAKTYKRVHSTFPDGARKECRLYRITRQMELIEKFFIDDFYGIFNGTGQKYIKFLHQETGIVPEYRITNAMYKSLLPQEAREEGFDGKNASRSVTVKEKNIKKFW